MATHPSSIRAVAKGPLCARRRNGARQSGCRAVAANAEQQLQGPGVKGRVQPCHVPSPPISTAPWKMPPKPKVSRVKRLSVLIASFACEFGVLVMSYTAPGGTRGASAACRRRTQHTVRVPARGARNSPRARRERHGTRRRTGTTRAQRLPSDARRWRELNRRRRVPRPTLRGLAPPCAWRGQRGGRRAHAHKPLHPRSAARPSCTLHGAAAAAGARRKASSLEAPHH